MKAFIEYVVKALVDFPDQVDIREVNGERMLVYELRLNKSDIGKVIGKQGRTIQSLRTLVNSASAKLGKRAVVEIIEDKPPEGEQAASPSPSAEMPPPPAAI
jgi:predicted RNA-binding protein YlqC (UPF0109 family)